jgi:CxxC-x17-CxxC domain-containing protein
MKGFNRSRVSREGGGFKKAGRGRPEGARPVRPERGGFRSFGRRGPDERFSGGFGRGERGVKPQMHEAICAKCGQRCEVPFKPLSNKPVYCSRCFVKDDSKKRPTQMSEEFDRINDKLDRILRALNLG